MRRGQFTAAITALATFVGGMLGVSSASGAASTEDVIHFVVDVSGSMASGGRLTEAVEAVKATAQAVDDDVALGLRRYAGSCDQSGVDPVVPIGLDNDEAIIAGADSLRAGGGTPTTAALGEGVEDVREYSTSGQKKLVLLTDGDTGCGISVCEYTAGLELGELELTLYTVGLQVSSGAAADLQCAAELTGGKYLRADEPTELVDILRGIVDDRDLDGDAIPDDWEESGRQLGPNLFDPFLPENGADPERKDAFVILEEAADARLPDDAIQKVVDAFANAPVSNPDGSNGINLHVIRGERTPAANLEYLKTTDDDEVVVDWDQLLERHSSLRLPYARYALSVNWPDWNAGGMVDDIGGQLMVLNMCGTPDFFNRVVLRRTCRSSANTQAANFMHELGHTFGLLHGGTPPEGCALEDSNPCAIDAFSPYKPNYLSVMNYSFSKRGVPGWGIDYSRWGTDDLHVLDETSLSENDGVLSPNNTLPDGLQTYFYCQQDGSRQKINVGQSADWNCSGGRSRGVEDGRVEANIDWPTSARGEDGEFTFTEERVILRPHDDWQWIADNSADAFGAGVIGTVDVYVPGPGMA